MIPAFIESAGKNLRVVVIKRGSKALDKPVFYQNFTREEIIKAKRIPLRLFLKKQSQLTLSPNGFIFHTGRGGSTLLCRMLGVSPENLVISEADALCSFFAKTKVFKKARRKKILKGLIESFIAEKRPREKRIFFKFASIDVLDLELILKTFPDVPWIFIHRDPIYTLSSQFLRPPKWVPYLDALIGRKNTGRQTNGAIKPYRETIEAQIKLLTLEYEAVLKHLNKNALIFDYEEIRSGIPSRLKSHFGLTLSPGDQRKIRSVLKKYSKDPNQKRAYQKKEEKASTPLLQVASFKGWDKLTSSYGKVKLASLSKQR